MTTRTVGPRAGDRREFAAFITEIRACAICNGPAGSHLCGLCQTTLVRPASFGATVGRGAVS